MICKNSFFSLNESQRQAIATQYGIDLKSLDDEKTSSSRTIDKRFLRDQSNDQNNNLNQPSFLSNLDIDKELQTQIQSFPSHEKACFDRYGNQYIDNNFDQNNKSSFNTMEIGNKINNNCFDENGNPLANDNYYAVKNKPSRFGLSIFDAEISTFSPFENIPVGDNYILGAGDELSIKLVGSENALLNLMIQTNGTIFVPKIGEISLSGLTFNDAIKTIQSRIEKELIGVNAFITMGRIKSINIFLAGEVNAPGMYSISALSTITQSLYQAGGISDIGSLRNIKVVRDGIQITAFDVYDLLIYGNAENDIRLRSGDVVLVQPYEGLVELKGNIKRPHQYEIKSGDTFNDLLKWSGGFEANAYPAGSTLSRSNSIGSTPTVQNINLLLEENLSKKILPNDSIMIPATGVEQRKYITLKGEINRPGRYGWTEGMKISDLLSKDGIYLDDFTNDTDLDIALIERLDQNTKQYDVMFFSPFKVLESINSTSNFELHEFDSLYFLPNNLLSRFLLVDQLNKKLLTKNIKGQTLQLFTIDGDVKFPGTYPLPSEFNLSKAIMIAGGASDTAFLDSVEISRVQQNSGELESKIFEIPVTKNSLEAANFLIKSRDRIYVRQNEDLLLERSFTVQGFVRFPGNYPLNSNETLKSAITRAGGLKSNSFPEGAKLIRKSLIEVQTDQNKNLASQIRSSFASSLLTSETKNIVFEDIELVARTIEDLPGEGRIVINLPEAMSDNAEFDISLEDGDLLIIPQTTNIINIIGEVKRPNVVSYTQGFDTRDYIELAGGFTQRADKEELYIIRANGSIISLQKSFFSLGLSKPKFMPGDTLVIPIKQNYQDPLPLWSQVTQIIYQSMVSLAAVKGL